MARVVALRVDHSGHAVAASEGGREWIANCGTSLCHRIVGAKTLDGKPVCTPTCAANLATGRGPGHASEQVVVRGEVARLNCHRIAGEAVVVVEKTESIAPSSDELLTHREREVLALIAEGLSSNEIARRLCVEGSTVRTHVEHLFRRLGVRTRAQAVARALETGQLDRVAATSP